PEASPCGGCGCRRGSSGQCPRPLVGVRDPGDKPGSRQPREAECGAEGMGGLATGQSDSKSPGEEVLVAIDRGKGDVMCLEGTGELAFQAFQLLHQPGAATRWQEEGIGRRLKAAADAEPAKRFSECFFNLPGLSLDHIRGTEDHEPG